MRGTVAKRLRKMAEAATQDVNPWFSGYQEAKHSAIGKRDNVTKPLMLKEGSGKDLYKQLKIAFKKSK